VINVYRFLGAATLTLIVWELVLRLGFVSPAALAYPGEVAHAIPSLFRPSQNLPDLWATVYRTIAAFALSIPIGVGVGVVLFYTSPVREPGRFAIDFLRSIPATALVPVFLIIYGVGDTTKIAVGAFSATLSMCLATMTGLERRNSTRLLVASLAGLTGIRRVFMLDLPEAARQLFLGLRTGVSLALILVVVSEMLIGANRGLGRVIADMQYTDDKGRMYAAILATGTLGYILNTTILWVERRETWWTADYE
jgi:ABC-type nitrate/sulfonate/bicarbonate transport system permease component